MKKGIFALLLVLHGCASNMAPVSERKWTPYHKNAAYHIVTPGETLFAIAFRYDKDYQALASANHLSPPYALRVGQKISLQENRAFIAKAPAPQVLPVAVTPMPHSSGWIWPVRGRIASSFVPSQGKKGINIVATQDAPILASASGIVAYAGSGLEGYGKLIIIKHANNYLTAYGNNSQILVKEGQSVQQGHIIGRAGLIEHRYPGLHFEIRKAGQPVNPMSYLK